MSELNWDVSSKDYSLIFSITERFFEVAKGCAEGINPLTVEMDITACHANGNPLRLEEMLNAEPFDLIHDVLGIYKNINRATGKLENCFSPRFSQ